MEILTIENITQDFEALATLDEVAVKYSVEEKYLLNYIKTKTGLDPLDFIKHLHVRTKLKIRKTILEKAEEGNIAMLSLVAKSYLPENQPKQLTLPFIPETTNNKKQDFSAYVDILKEG
jgi:hypothetical protein